MPDYKRARDWEEYRDMLMISEHLDEVEKKTEAYLEKADENELGRRVNFTVRSGSFDLSAEECLLQSFTEQLYHMGELIALLWQEDIEPPRIQWFWNNRKMRSSLHPQGCCEGRQRSAVGRREAMAHAATAVQQEHGCLG